MKSTDQSLYALRIHELKQAIRQKFSQSSENGIIFLAADFEQERILFRQESSFYYLTGIKEPSVVCTISMSSHSILWIPRSAIARAQWVDSPIALVPENARALGFDEVRYLGSQGYGYQLHPFFSHQEYDHLLTYLKQAVNSDASAIFTLSPDDAHSYVNQRFLLQRIESFIPGFVSRVIDVSEMVASQRRHKDMHEIEKLYNAIEITSMAQQAAANAIAPDVLESEVHAAISYIFSGSQAQEAFPSIVASGKNATILHYSRNASRMKQQDLVLVDIGATADMYCGDITRTYPARGTFTQRQKDLYMLVLEAQQLIADKAVPGMWLSSKQHPEKSLYHIAKNFFAKKGYDSYFTHGIGHFLGIDVHDVGDYSIPLQEGDVFTIEPGLYIPQEGIGIRIEDNYWLTSEGVICLSDEIPKEISEIESIMQSNSFHQQSTKTDPNAH